MRLDPSKFSPIDTELLEKKELSEEDYKSLHYSDLADSQL
jgi:hypothetical protein